MVDLTPHEAEDVERFVHAVEHARARKGIGLPETATVHMCWNYPIGDLPTWADQAAAAGKPSVTWCPVLDPSLRDRGDD